MGSATVITDASSCHETRAGGWAYWVTYNPPEGEVQRITKFGSAQYDNSGEAEHDAARRGIRAAYKAGARQILIQSDCTSVVQLIEEFHSDTNYPGINVRFRHVKGHTGLNDARSWVNRWCDRHAKQSMRAARDKRSLVVDLNKV